MANKEARVAQGGNRKHKHKGISQKNHRRRERETRHPDHVHRQTQAPFAGQLQNEKGKNQSVNGATRSAAGGNTKTILQSRPRDTEVERGTSIHPLADAAGRPGARSDRLGERALSANVLASRALTCWVDRAVLQAAEGGALGA